MRNKIVYNPGIPRRENAYSKAVNKSLPYRFTEDGKDALILGGDWQGKLVSEVWVMGAEERDIVFVKLYKSDPHMKEIIDNLCCE